MRFPILCLRGPLFVLIAVVTAVLSIQMSIAAQADIRTGVLYNCPTSSLYNFKVLECPPGRYCKVLMVNTSTPSASFETELDKTRMQDAFRAGGCTMDGKPLDAVKGAPAQIGATPVSERTANSGSGQAGRFKVGDRVKACPMQMADCTEYWENCTVLKDYMTTERADSYQVRCDDPRGGKGTVSNVPGKLVRGGAPPEAAPPECPFTEPPGTVAKTAAPSAQLFQRVIFERYQYMNPGKQVGVTFKDFSLASTTRNRVVGGHLIQQGASMGATLYRYKAATFLLCVKNPDDTVSRTEAQEQYFMCFKDKSGDWACSEDGRRNWDHRTVRVR